ncbi:MAG: hypothetical protein Q9222_006944 [Ikaeria aurantiellina]
MSTVCALTVSILFPLVQAQLKACRQWDGFGTPDHPCDPEAAVWLFRLNICGPTDEGYAPDLARINGKPQHTTFDYQLNTTSCDDGTICPKNDFSSSPNTTCCESHQGKTETYFNNPAVMPTSVADLSSYYAVGNYTIVSDSYYRTAVRASATVTSSLLPSATDGTATGIPTATPALSPTTPVVESPSSSPSSSTGGLSTGAAVGIAVAVTAVIILVLILLVYIYCLRRRRKPNSKDLPYQQESNISPKPELPVHPSAMEVDAGREQQVPSKHEMCGFDARMEMEAKELPELPSKA